MLTKKFQKSSENYFCHFCNYNTCRKSQYERHLTTRKHEMLTNVDKKVPKSSEPLFVCECGKKYKHRQSLSIHKKKCEKSFDYIIENDISNNDNNMKDLIVKLMTENNEIKNTLIHENSELKKQIGELIPKVGNTNNTNNTNNTINNINQKFNINIFLNEQCKDALNINDFIKNIEISLDQLDLTKHNGLADGLSYAIIENMNKLSLYERPLHCTDLKRETLYIKDNDSWEKDNNKTKIKKVINDVSKKQYKALQEWTENNPDFEENENKQEYFAKTLSVIGMDPDKVDEKIIKNICNKIYVKDKTESE